MVEGMWKAESKILPPHGLPEQIRLRIKWEAPNLEYQTMEMRSDKAKHNPWLTFCYELYYSNEK